MFNLFKKKQDNGSFFNILDQSTWELVSDKYFKWEMGKIKHFIALAFLLVFSHIVYPQTVKYSRGSIDQIIFTLTPCNRSKAINTLEFLIDSKSFYQFDIYQFDFNDVRRYANISSGEMSDLIKIYNGYSYGTINYGYDMSNCKMYCNSNTGQYSLIQFADFNLGGGVVNQNLKRIFERSVTQVDNK